MTGQCKVVAVVLVISLTSIIGMVNGDWKADFQRLKKEAVDIAGLFGMSHQGTTNRGKGCVINWSYEGMLIGLKYKFMGLCTDSCTGETVTVFKESKGGAVEHCFNDLMQKLKARNEL